MALLIPPQLLTLITAVFMWCIAASKLVKPIPLEILPPLALATFIVAFVIGSAALYALASKKTTLAHNSPQHATTLVRGGIYKYSRHPMYLSMILLLTSVAFWFANPINVMPLMAFIGYIVKFQVIPEELALENRFPRQAADYKSRVRRWI